MCFTVHIIFLNFDKHSSELGCDTCLAPKGFKRSISGPRPKKVVHHWDRCFDGSVHLVVLRTRTSMTKCRSSLLRAHPTGTSCLSPLETFFQYNLISSTSTWKPPYLSVKTRVARCPVFNWTVWYFGSLSSIKLIVIPYNACAISQIFCAKHNVQYFGESHLATLVKTLTRSGAPQI